MNEIRTKGGQRVVGLQYVPRNSCGDMVTYPIKGSIVRCEKPLKLEYNIWSPEGIWCVVWGWNPKDNLESIPEELQKEIDAMLAATA